jgi:hypothetical protein
VRIILSQHVINKKIPLIKSLGWNITNLKIKKILTTPKWKGTTSYNQSTVMGLLDKNHILRIVFRRDDDIIFVITVHVARRGTYESTK